MSELTLLAETQESVLGVIVPPDSSEPIRLVTSMDQLQAERGSWSGIAVPGVSSTTVASASLARLLAKHLSAPVLGTVPVGLKIVSALTNPMEASHFFAQDESYRQDVEQLMVLLRLSGKSCHALLGYSRGAWVIRDALITMKALQEWKLLDTDMRLIILGAVIDSGWSIEKTTQLIGALDYVGQYYSSMEIPHRLESFASHHINPMLPFALDANSALKLALQKAEH